MHVLLERKLTTNLPCSIVGKMGQLSDPMAVVDSTGKVFGVSRLRVADISAFPLLPPGHPQATVCECLLLLLARRSLSM